jgi:hypothetical protein
LCSYHYTNHSRYRKPAEKRIVVGDLSTTEALPFRYMRQNLVSPRGCRGPGQMHPCVSAETSAQLRMKSSGVRAGRAKLVSGPKTSATAVSVAQMMWA